MTRPLALLLCVLVLAGCGLSECRLPDPGPGDWVHAEVQPKGLSLAEIRNLVDVSPAFPDAVKLTGEEEDMVGAYASQHDGEWMFALFLHADRSFVGVARQVAEDGVTTFVGNGRWTCLVGGLSLESWLMTEGGGEYVVSPGGTLKAVLGDSTFDGCRRQ